MTAAYLEALEMGYFEVQEAFKGLADENVWKRPADGLLSIGELAGHIAYWEAIRLAGEGEDLATCRVSSPLIDNRFRYYQPTLAMTPAEQHLAMTAEQVCRELVRVHEETIADFKAHNPDPASHIPGCPTGFTYGEYLKYAVFHVAYHTGQIYSARHLLGEETPDN
jgi:uncharacterized damage-inducible protein DinB